MVHHGMPAKKLPEKGRRAAGGMNGGETEFTRRRLRGCLSPAVGVVNVHTTLRQSTASNSGSPLPQENYGDGQAKRPRQWSSLREIRAQRRMSRGGAPAPCGAGPWSWCNAHQTRISDREYLLGRRRTSGSCQTNEHGVARLRDDGGTKTSTTRTSRR